MKKLIREILMALYIRRVKRQIQRDLARAYCLTTKEIQVKILHRTPVKYRTASFSYTETPMDGQMEMED